MHPLWRSDQANNCRYNKEAVLRKKRAVENSPTKPSAAVPAELLPQELAVCAGAMRLPLLAEPPAVASTSGRPSRNFNNLKLGNTPALRRAQSRAVQVSVGIRLRRWLERC